MSAAAKTAAERLAEKIAVRKTRRVGTKRPSGPNYNKAHRAGFAPNKPGADANDGFQEWIAVGRAARAAVKSTAAK